MIARKFTLATLVAAGAFASAGCTMMNQPSSSSPAMATPMMSNSMTVALTGRNQVPPNASGGSGTAKVELDGSVLKWSVSYQGLTGPVTGAHFHGPASAGANAGVVVPFAGSMASPITGSATLTAAQVADLKAGLYYINLHTAANPGGELRGQVR